MSVRVLMLIVVLLGGCQRSGNSDTLPDTEDLYKGVSAQDLFDNGVGHAQAGDLVRAEQYITAASDRGQAASDTVPWLVRICIASNRYQAALGHAEPYLRSHPEDWSLRFLVGTIHGALGNLEQARQELERAAHDAPDQADVHYHLGTLYAESFDDRATALVHYRRYVELNPDGKHAREVRAYIDDPNAVVGGPKRVDWPTEIPPSEARP